MSRRLDDAEIGQRTINQLLAIPALRLVSTNHELGIQAARIATNYKLRGADAFYAAVAAQLKVPLVSWDKEHIYRAAALITAYTPEYAPLP